MLVAVQLPGVVVEGGHSREQEAAVAAAGAAGDRVPLEHDRVDAALGERAGAGQAADPAADHAHLGLHPAAQRRARLVGSVEPVGERARAHRTPSRLLGKRGVLAGGDRAPHFPHQLGHEGEIVQRDQALRRQLVRPSEVVQVPARVLAAGRARAACVDRLAARSVRRPCRGRAASGRPDRGPGRFRAERGGWGSRSRRCRCRRRRRARGRRRRRSRAGGAAARPAGVAATSPPPRASAPSTGPASRRWRSRGAPIARRRRSTALSGPHRSRPARSRKRAGPRVCARRASAGSDRASGECAPSSGRCSRARRGRACTRRRRARCRIRAWPAPPSRSPGP